MGYYLSKRNEEFLLEFLPLLKNTKQSITLETNDADRLIYILRNAAATDKYRWLGNKFIFSKKPVVGAERISMGVLCKTRDTTVNIHDGIKSITERADLVFIVNALIQEKPIAIRFTNTFLTESEYERLEAFTLVNQYKLSKSENVITIIKT